MPETPAHKKFSWLAKNVKLVIYIVLLLGGAVAAGALLLNDVSNNSKQIECHDTAIDTLIKKQTVLNLSFTSYRESVDEELEDIAEDLEEIAEETSETHDAVIKIVTEMGID